MLRRPFVVPAQAEGWMEDFVDYLQKQHPAVRQIGDVQPSMARAYVATVEARGVSGKTCNNILIFSARALSR